MDASVKIELLSEAAADALLDHSERVLGESGRDGVPIFHVYDEATPWTRDRARIVDRWARPLNRYADAPRPEAELGWTRTFGLWVDGEIRGATSLWGNTLRSAFHRVNLSLGVERAHHGLGYGTRLMEAAREWATSEGFEYIDLFVFEGNDPAIALYRKLGYVETGRAPDRWRIAGKRIGDLTFALPLRAKG
ncbi:MAG: GNAT family N-acetyltransferase [Bdellovibrionales bacterium]|nr:GNAT family N-acetyltransferase [Bdellovibrionales bacterium]